ncbi:ABC transporter ATP-binding protein [Candidatus Pseudothioglobus singularis]|jgi:sn-glycerol 3-phosphate transport system ATP-binding protein|uniref:ABC transporter ATP-binding protein n=1 Tax=Candidatus Pseudothioglobus singularis TaxID=1427364 RepID=UPI000377DFD0|nr:ABC transporter ATP-binding protein [Candidatus Pseudothioglobus singularis]ANQ66351.1 ABC transporter ATP-binding protein [Candidatus Pseudothioglobus singularis]MDA9800925.1 ABC transporter ATP-binding protein [Candidatus Pseudothioglobus singularis]MDB4598500.1 ABC transporter ATP-binding protein [Candidatus Pseudothioglobus singularis]MDC0621013.1 ABC transporter ATP-binding protein [Candidatus Pseudothioglobus singularis]MDC0980897.1 ABC transporter ATP-binding protein [Candidatus Pseu|tara:strand:+ start:1399 stop:2436 length:1038 start_codon:yes stop_codon:yes gene_type:complete
MSAIEVKNLSKSWGDIDAVKNVSFSVKEESFTVLLGPSGCGKSTILKMLSGLENVTSGTIKIENKDVTEVEASKRGVSMVFQSYALFPHLNVKENIQFGLKVRKVPPAEREKRVNEAAKVVGLSDLLDRKPANLSGGQRQRVALARSIVSDQSVCLMDEPLSNLDSKLRAEMRDEIRDLQKRLGLTVVYVTHDQVEAMSMADQIILLNSGEIIQKGAPEEIYNYPNSIFSAQFIGLPPMNILKLKDLDIASLSKENQEKIKASNNSINLGIRPEHLVFSKKGLPVVVNGIDYFGGETVFKVSHLDQEFFLREPRQPKINLNDKLNISWSPDDMHLFKKNNQRITS